MVAFGQLPATRLRLAAPARGVDSLRLSELRERFAAEDLARPQRADCHLLALVSAGRGNHSIDFVRYDCRPGTVFWSRPGQVQQFGREPALDATLLLFTAEFLPAVPGLEPLLDDPFAPVCWQPMGEDQDAILTEVTQISTDCARYASTYDTVAVELLRHQLAVLLMRVVALELQGAAVADPMAPRRGAGGEVMAAFRREIEASFGTTRRVEDYAERLGCSVRTLTRACLTATGRSAKQVIDDRVTLEAKRLLAHSDLPVATIGFELGFSEPTNFGRFFARETGLTPGEFRNAPSLIEG
jgi:AraC-like DNA-binding protein